jgi:hypothetical protein
MGSGDRALEGEGALRLALMDITIIMFIIII